MDISLKKNKKTISIEIEFDDGFRNYSEFINPLRLIEFNNVLHIYVRFKLNTHKKMTFNDKKVTFG